jgi:hypothetical protein
MSIGLVRLFAVTLAVIGSLALTGMAMADCSPTHQTTASTSTGTKSGG